MRRGRSAALPLSGASPLPLVALVGRPNVGKSSLYNRLVGGRPALVEDMPGVTRDRRYGEAEWIGARFRVVDTGGLDPSAAGILGAMRAQTQRAIDEADVLIFVVDVVEGTTAVDADVAAALRRTGKPVLVAANKVDSDKREAAAGDAFALGFPDVFPLSAAHGRGVAELLDRVKELLGDAALQPPSGPPLAAAMPRRHARPAPARRAAGARDGSKGDADSDGDSDGDSDSDSDSDAAGDDGEAADGGEAARAEKAAAAAEEAARPIRIAFVGKPNAGKSSLVNRLLGHERVLVHDQPGTTRDPIDTPFTWGGREMVLVDTAGLRRRRALGTLTEAVADKMARDQLARADVAVLVIDAKTGAGTEDAKIAGLIEEAGRAAILVLNKRDAVARAGVDKVAEAARETLAFIRWAPILMTSATTGAGVAEIPAVAARVFAEAGRRVSTGELNRFFEAVVTAKPPPAGPNGRHVRLYYVTQASVYPPTFIVSTNHAEDVPVAYQRFLANQLRKTFGFEGTPIRMVLRTHRRKVKAPPPRLNSR